MGCLFTNCDICEEDLVKEDGKSHYHFLIRIHDKTEDQEHSSALIVCDRCFENLKAHNILKGKNYDQI